ncbi:MAG: DUF927 domain-containing protein [Acidobacteriia bacterium]|nr:DUF927 domain-containing protein [Terriglobia bacterium]
MGKELRGPCPIHQGQRDSFSVEPATGRWYCHSKCARGGGLIGLEMELSNLRFRDALDSVFRIVGRPLPTKPKREVTGTFVYENGNGRPVYRVLRIESSSGKSFVIEHPGDQGKWVKGLGDAHRVPYHLPDLMKAQRVLISEGEKKAELLKSWGYAATCNSEGAGKWLSEFSVYFKTRESVILPDNDEAGMRHALSIAQNLLPVAGSVRILELPNLPPKGDVCDWEMMGGTREKIEELISQAPSLDTRRLAEWSKRFLPNECSESRKAIPHADATRFRVVDDGVYYTDPNADNEPIRICSPLEIVAATRNDQGEGWGRLLKWSDGEREHFWAMPMALLAGAGDEYRCVSRLGWHDRVFVFPDSTIGLSPNDQGLVFQSPLDTQHFFNECGSLDEWTKNVGQLCSGNSRLVFLVSCAFAAPLLRLSKDDSGGFHLHGTSSTGKTTALLVAGSVWGGGGRNGFVESWRTTVNGLEAFGDLHNDSLGCLDEISQLDSREATESLYLLANGQGKQRMTKTLGLRQRLSWTTLFISSGEITLSQHSESGGKHTRAGADIRLVNISADAGAQMGIFEDLHGFESSEALSRHLRDASKMFYGKPIRRFLEYVTGNRPGVEDRIGNFRTEFLAGNLPPSSSGEVRRAAGRFALAAAAGELATDIGLTGWQRGEAKNAASCCLVEWIEARGTIGLADSEAGVRQVRAFIEAHGASRFQSVLPRRTGIGQEIPERVVNRAGFKRENPQGETEYLVLSEVFKGEVCNGFDYQMVAHTLADRGFLVCDAGRLTLQVRLPEVEKTRVYAIKSAILET